MKLTLGAATALLVLALAARAGAEGPPARTVAWARTQANAKVAVDLHDYFGLTLRFVAAHRGATCAGLGAPVAHGWVRFRCTAWLKADEGPKFPGAVRATFVLQAPTGAVTGLVVTRCTGIICPVR